jgi:hypothetical protein
MHLLHTFSHDTQRTHKFVWNAITSWILTWHTKNTPNLQEMGALHIFWHDGHIKNATNLEEILLFPIQRNMGAIHSFYSEFHENWISWTCNKKCEHQVHD